MERLISIKKNSVNTVLFLQGVYKTECTKLDDMFHDKIFSSPSNHNLEIIYDKIPAVFTTLDKWPKSTNLLCWWCCRSFKTRPWFEPLSIEPTSETANNEQGKILSGKDLIQCENKKGLCISTNGNFCSANCVQSHINNFSRDLSDKLNRSSMLRYVYEIYNRKSIPDIQPAPVKTIRIQFGGSYSDNEYQSKIDHLDVSYARELEDNSFSSICQIGRTFAE
jgi:hypothetical protein